jgi:NAD(P)-dependent dehydrogenase (short-subunit alcohol dehydrogenase family)
MQHRPSDDAVWITGASSGIGRALALRLARVGRTVVASARNVDALASLSAEARAFGGRIESVPLDVTGEGAVLDAVERIERTIAPISLAILNAGLHIPVDPRDFKVADFRQLAEINLFGTLHCLGALLPRMIGRRGGHIAIVASVAGYGGLPTAAAYGMTKAGLINMAEALRPELAALGIELQVVNPGFVRTPLTDRNRFPMPFLVEAEDAAAAIEWGLARRRFEIAFPRRFVLLMKLLRLLPYPLFFAITRRLVPRAP